MHVHKIFSLRIAVDTCMVRITLKAVCASSKHDDQNDNLMNTLAFVNFLLIKIFPTLICQYFPPSNFAPYGIWHLCQDIYRLCNKMWLEARSRLVKKRLWLTRTIITSFSLVGIKCDNF